jgi:hypothetical protein
VQGVPQSQPHREKKLKKAKQKPLYPEPAQYIRHYSRYTDLAVLPSQQTLV